MAKHNSESDDILEMLYTDESHSDDEPADSSGSDADTWCSEEECSDRQGIDPFEDIKEDEKGYVLPLVPINRFPKAEEKAQEVSGFQLRGHRPTPYPPPIPTPLTETGQGSETERGPGKIIGKGKKRESGAGRCKAHVLDGPIEQESGWNGPEVADTAQQLPKFCPKRAPGLQGFVGVTYSPAQIFRQFFSVTTVRVICCNTNINAEKELSKGKKFAWEKLTSDTFLKYIGLLIYMALLKLPRVRDYWRRDSHLSVHFPVSVMTRDRFMAISRTVHLSNPDEDIENDRKNGTPDYDPLYRLKPLYTKCAASLRLSEGFGH
ncbi:uncharacterized protein [Danio rerio]|uniref:PiggyBac transposable element-derived protein domain-containing protein n=1 Tax=Danio rerio TaxID=7955 RepID=A0A8M3AW26_DANRE